MNSIVRKPIGIIFLFLLSQFVFAQDKAILKKDIEQILSKYQVRVGITAAVNDIGVVSLPDGDVFYITVLVTDSKEEEPVSAKAMTSQSV